MDNFNFHAHRFILTIDSPTLIFTRVFVIYNIFLREGEKVKHSDRKWERQG